MYTHRPLPTEQSDETVANRQTAGLLGIAITLIILVVSLFLVQHLRHSAAVEDCLLAGRRNCDALVTPQN